MMSAQTYNPNWLELAVVDLGAGSPPPFEAMALQPSGRCHGHREVARRRCSSLGGDGRGAGLADMISKIGRVASARLKISSYAGEIIQVRNGFRRGRHAGNVTCKGGPGSR